MYDYIWSHDFPLTEHKRFENKCAEIQDKYSGDFDTMPGLPPVTFTEMQLLLLIHKLETRVHDLEEERRFVMNKIRDIKLETYGITLRAELFAHGDITLAKLASSDPAYFEGNNIDYGWAFRAPEDKPNRMKGMTVALGKAMDSCLLAPKVRHELFSQLTADPKPAPSETNPWRPLTETHELQPHSRNYAQIGAFGIQDLELRNAEGKILSGGFGTGVRKFWIGAAHSPRDWESERTYVTFNPTMWRYKPEPDLNPWRSIADTTELQPNSRNFQVVPCTGIHGLEFMDINGDVLFGGFGTGVRMFWVKYDGGTGRHWMAKRDPLFTLVSWRYANA